MEVLILLGSSGPSSTEISSNGEDGDGVLGEVGDAYP